MTFDLAAKQNAATTNASTSSAFSPGVRRIQALVGQATPFQHKIAGQPAHTREGKLGCVFTQTTWDEKGYPLCALASTTYTGTVETAGEFGRRLFREAWTQGWSHVLLRVVIGQHLFVGSGVIEAGCKTVIASRLKQSGMFWTIRGANVILALRGCYLNGRFEDYWEGRRAALAA